MTPATFVPWPESSFQADGSWLGAPPTQDALRAGSMLRSGRCGSRRPCVDHADDHVRAPTRDRMRLRRADPLRVPLEREKVSASTTGELGSSPSQPQPVAVAATLPTEATPATRRSWSSVSAKAGSLDSAMTTSICGYEATTEPPAPATSCAAVPLPGRAPDRARRSAPPRPDRASTSASKAAIDGTTRRMDTTGRKFSPYRTSTHGRRGARRPDYTGEPQDCFPQVREA